MSFRIIPVIDVMGGLVVHASGGERDRYRPLIGPLVRSSEPAAILASYLDLFPFQEVYVADLDAIMGRGDNLGLVHGLVSDFPALTFWVDAGRRGFTLNEARIVPVLGTETGISRPELARLVADPPAKILCLDFREGTFLGCMEILAASENWPGTIMLMDLRLIGAKDGPPLQLASAVIPTTTRNRHDVFLGGGVRDPADLDNILAAGFRGALVATALFNGSISASDLGRAMGKKTPAGAGVCCGLDNPTGL